MDYRRLGSTGLKVSPLCLGMMSYGSPGWQPWILEKEAARDFVKLALDNGVNFFDASDFCSYGQSEEALGTALSGLGVRREQTVISTKVGMPMSGIPNEQGNSRKRIRDGIDASLRWLETDYFDLYLLHKWDLRSRSRNRSTRSSTIAQEEIFGPVGVIIRFETEEDLVEMANDTPFGLSLGIWTEDYRKAMRVARAIKSGTIWVNTHKIGQPSVPMGGFKESGIGRENGIDAILEYLQIKNTYWNLNEDPIAWPLRS